MRNFMDKDFLLDSDAAKKLYGYAGGMPVIDYHCHINPQEIYEDKYYDNIAQLWLGVGGSNFGDHYKWRFMRSCGVEERFITGTEPDEERFVKWAECLGRAIGNPLYHWSHMELRKYFGFDGFLNGDNARKVYRFCNEKLQEGGLSVRSIIEKSNVKLICTTDDPADSLIWHKKLRTDRDFSAQVLPAMRPDKAKDIEKVDYLTYLEKLGVAAGLKIESFADLKEAMVRRMDYFESLGCCVSDHGLQYVTYSPAPDYEIERIFAKRLAGRIPDRDDIEKFQTAFMLFVGHEYSARGWVMQLHYGVKRDNNTEMYKKLGPDTGFDCISNFAPSSLLVDFLNALESGGHLPKTIIYSLNTNDNAAIGSVIGCFQNSDAVAKIQQGSAWWFNDHITGMTEQMISLANLGNLSGFVGMLTDSRSFLSYTRHDYFRRILCRLLGGMVERGEYPADWKTLKDIVCGISYNNAVRYFEFNLPTE